MEMKEEKSHFWLNKILLKFSFCREMSRKVFLNLLQVSGWFLIFDWGQ